MQNAVILEKNYQLLVSFSIFIPDFPFYFFIILSTSCFIVYKKWEIKFE